MRRQPKNPKTSREDGTNDPRNSDDFDPMRWSIERNSDRIGPPVPSNPEDWCIQYDTNLSSLKIKEPAKRKQVRCPRCKRRILLRERRCVGGEFICWLMPPHKKPPAKKAKPKRRERRSRLP